MVIFLDFLTYAAALARDNKLQEVEDEVINNPKLLAMIDGENRSALHWAVDRENLGIHLYIYTPYTHWVLHCTAKGLRKKKFLFRNPDHAIQEPV